MDKYEIKESIGNYLEGVDAENEGKELLLDVLHGSIDTDQGLQRYYIDMESLLLEHIDLSEAIWSLGEGETYRGDLTEVVFFDQLNDIHVLHTEILSQENGSEKWQRLQLKVLNKLNAIKS